MIFVIWANLGYQTRPICTKHMHTVSQQAYNFWSTTLNISFLSAQILTPCLVEALLKLKTDALISVELLDRMKLVGYDLGSLLYSCTKSLLLLFKVSQK